MKKPLERRAWTTWSSSITLTVLLSFTAGVGQAGNSCTEASDCTCVQTCGGSTGPNVPECYDGTCKCNCQNP